MKTPLHIVPANLLKVGRKLTGLKCAPGNDMELRRSAGAKSVKGAPEISKGVVVPRPSSIRPLRALSGMNNAVASDGMLGDSAFEAARYHRKTYRATSTPSERP